MGVADVIVDLVSTGSTLRVNGLREVETLFESTALLVARAETVTDPLRADAVAEIVGASSWIRRVSARHGDTSAPASHSCSAGMPLSS